MPLDYITAIMLLSSYCNMDCQYCYALKGIPKKRGQHMMSAEVALATLDQLLELPVHRIDFNWHGGEPLLIELEFMQKVIDRQSELQKKHPDKKIYAKVQTNGTLVTHEWASFFKRNDIGVGVSIDGPEIIQNRQRPLLDGGGSFEHTMQGIQVLDYSSVEGGKLLVVTPYSLANVVEIYNFFKSNMPDFDIIPCFHVDKASGNVIEPTINPEQYGDFLIRLFDLWVADDDPGVYIRFFDEILQVMLGGRSTLCSITRGCAGFITIDWNGDVYPCDNFSGYSEFHLGNVLEQTIGDIMGSNQYRDMIQRMTAVPDDCKSCQWLDHCNGGCAHQSFIPGFSFNQRNYYCKSRRRFFSHISKWLKAMQPLPTSGESKC